MSAAPVRREEIPELLAGQVTAPVRFSESLEGIPDGSIDLILTDPPYFDNLSYSELSDFYLAWHQSLGMAEPPYDNPAIAEKIQQWLKNKP